MSKLTLKDRVPRQYDAATVTELFRLLELQGNQLAEGRIIARHAASTAAPTNGDWVRGDIAWKSDPSEAGSAGSRYVILGYVCVTSGSPGTWVELRCLTGS